MGRLSGYGGNVLVGSQLVEDCEDAWDELVDGDVTESLDTSDYKIGSGSAKFVCATALANGDIIATELIASLNLSSYTELLFWMKSSVNITTAGDLQLLLDDSPNCASPVVTLDVPVLTADTWKFCKATGTFTGATAIVSVGVKLTAHDPGAFNLWIDEIRAAKSVAGIRAWSLDLTMEVVEVTGFDSSGHKVFIPTIDNWAGSFEGFKDAAPLTIGSIYGLELQESSTATQQWRGSAIITAIHASTPVDGVVTYSYDFQGIDKLEQASA